MRFKIGLLTLLLFLQPSPLIAGIDPTVAARISVAAAQNLLISLPIPSLESGGKPTITPQIGTMSAVAGGKETPAAEGANKYDYTGTLTGTSVGIGYTSPPHGRIGWYGILVGSKMTGEIKNYEKGEWTYEFKDINSSVIAGTFGMSYRFLGDSKSPLAMGIFFGPTYMKVMSSFDSTQNPASSGASTYQEHFDFSPTMYGAMAGLQFKTRLGPFLFNPYGLYMQELTPKCKEVGNGSSLGTTCRDEPSNYGRADLDATFYGFGVYIGYKGLRFNAYSKSYAAKEYADIDMTAYSLGYSFGVSDLF